MRRFAPAALLLVLALPPACAGEPAPGLDRAGTFDRTMKFGEVTRRYRIHLPQGFSLDHPVPLVIAIHGMGSNGRQTEELTAFDELGDRKGFAAAYPEGENRAWSFFGNGSGGLKIAPPHGEGGDIQFLSAMIEELRDAGVIDSRRVYATGISNGGYMSNRLGCELADRIAAIAPVSGTMTRVAVPSHNPSRPVPVLYIHGTDDQIVGFDGKDRFTGLKLSLSAGELVRWWARANGCEGTPKKEELPDLADDGTTVERWTYAPGRDGAEVVFYKVIGGGHTWPNSPLLAQRALGTVCHDFTASEAIWEFFSRHSLREGPAKGKIGPF